MWLFAPGLHAVCIDHMHNVASTGRGRSMDCPDSSCPNESPTSVNLANYNSYTFNHGSWSYIPQKQRYSASYGYIDEKPHFEVRCLLYCIVTVVGLYHLQNY